MTIWPQFRKIAKYFQAAYIKQIGGPFLVLGIYPCFECSLSHITHFLILNTESGAERFLGAVGNVVKNSYHYTISYQLLQETSSCRWTAGHYHYNDEPTGEVFRKLCHISNKVTIEHQITPS